MPVLGRYNVLLVDLDGVVWRGARIILENVEWLRAARERGARIIYVTNNSTRSRRVYADKLTRIMGYRVDPSDVVNSGYAAAVLVREMKKGPARILPVGEEGLVEELVLQGHLVFNPADPVRCPLDYVVVGLDRGLSYQRLRAAHEAVTQCGAGIVATNMDPTIPVEKGDAPGAGSILAALEASTGRRPVANAGKPEPYMYMLALRSVGAGLSEALVIGDRCDTDIEAARRAGIDSVLVLTGVAAERGQECSATYKVATLKELMI